MSDVDNAPETSGGEQEPASAADELGSIFDEIEARDTDQDDAEGPARDPETGRFVAKDGTEDEGEPATPGADGESADAEDDKIAADSASAAEDEAEDDSQAPDPPASWSAEAKALWPSLPPKVREEALRREQDWQRADTERAQKLKGYEPIDAALEPVRQHLNLNGVEPAQYVRQLVAADQFLRTEPLQAVQWIAQQYGIDLSQLNRQGEEIDPSLAPLHQEINTLKSALQQQMEAQQQAERNRLQAEITAFGQDHPHLDEVREDMARYIANGLANDLQTAYDKAVWANESTRAKLLAEQAGEAEAKRKKEAEERAAKAKRVAETNLSSKGSAGGQTPEQFNSREDELSSIYDRVQGAA